MKSINVKPYIIEYVKTIPSTNTYLLDNYSSHNSFNVIYTFNQTHGKGRMGHVWENEGEGLALSILLKDDILRCQDSISLITLLTGACVNKVLSKYVKCTIKWPNDIMVKDKKVSGILCESKSTSKIDALVVGIGINLYQESFKAELENKATSLFMETGRRIDCDKLISDLLLEFKLMLDSFLNKDYVFLDYIRDNFYLKGKKVIVNDEEYEVLGLSDAGEIVLEKNMSTIKLGSGEISLSGSYK